MSSLKIINGMSEGTSTSTSSTTTRTRTRAYEYAKGCGLRENPNMERWLTTLIERDMIEELVLFNVIDETIVAPAPSWRYFAAIVRRLLAEVGMDEKYTLEMWHERQDRWEVMKGRIF